MSNCTPDDTMLHATDHRKSPRPGLEPAFPDYPTDYLDTGNATGGHANGTAAPVIIVRAEEALIVILVLVLWVAAIALFFNRWGKIRMLEPYQPKFQAHRPSCPLVEIDGALAAQHRSFSKFNVNGIADPLSRGLLRPRQNSVFVGGSATMLTYPCTSPRRAKSAIDIQTLLSAEAEVGSNTPAATLRLGPSKMDVRPCSFDPRLLDVQLRKVDGRRKVDNRRMSVMAACSGVNSVMNARSTFLDVRKPGDVRLLGDGSRRVSADVRRVSCVNLDLRRPSCSRLLDKSFLVSQV